MLKYKHGLTNTAKQLRKNMTRQERHLWYDFLKTLPVKVYRQHPIENYIVDFYIPSKKTVIELDGSQHFTDLASADKKRDRRLSDLGICVIRYPNDAVDNHFFAVCNDILQKLGISFGVAD